MDDCLCPVFRKKHVEGLFWFFTVFFYFFEMMRGVKTFRKAFTKRSYPVTETLSFILFIMSAIINPRRVACPQQSMHRRHNRHNSGCGGLLFEAEGIE